VGKPEEQTTAAIQAAQERSLLGSRDRRLGGRFSDALVEEAKRVSGITENTDLLTYALIRVFGGGLLARKGRIPKGTMFGGWPRAASYRAGTLLRLAAAPTRRSTCTRRTADTGC
jgi:hypothetical protein